MARGSDEHRMVFDIRGRRRHVVKFVYAILAVLMGLSLFLVTGAVNVGSIFGSSSSGETAVSNFEKQAENIETKLVKTPGDEDLLASLTRTRINTANSMITNGAGESQSGVEEVKQQLALASEDWTKYVKASEEPSPGVAIQVAPALFQLAEISTSTNEALENVKAATEAQEIVADTRPSLNSLSTLAIYQLFAQDYKGAKESTAEATKLASDKFEREQIENKIEETEKNAKTFGKSIQAEKATKSESAGKETLENPLGTSGLGGG
jgi:septal ring factor EnvC (AmiA/AmiB activator)